MNITLYWIPGISKTDTPVFLSLEAQEAYFADCERKVVSTGFYPPYFRNSIKFDTEDLDLTTWYPNYVSLVFNDKTFYYFIVEKRYINEDIVEITIEMDTIQTYMFDVTWVNAVIDRLTITRWLANRVTINREYIRENLSENSFSKIDTRRILNMSVDANGIGNWYMVIKYSDAIRDTHGEPRTLHFIENKDNSVFGVYSPYEYGITPLRRGKDVDTPANEFNFWQGFDDLAKDPKVLDIFLVPFRLAEDIECDTFDTTISDYSIDYGGINALALIANNNTNVLVPFYTFCSYVNYASINVGIVTPGTAVGAAFDSKSVPAMLDSNYIRLTFGDNSIQTSYPLEIMTETQLYGTYWADISTGNLYYNLVTDSDDKLNNNYSTIVCNSAGFHSDLKNDPWESYIAQNRATLAGAFITSGITLLASAGLGAIKPIAGEMAAMSSVGKGAKNISHYFVNKANLEQAPSEVKRTGNLVGDTFLGDLAISYKIWLCDDFKDIARYYESNGYKVVRYMTTSLFAIDNRYFYDYVQTKEINVQLGDRNTQEDFENRFNSGLRMWHTDSEGLLRARGYGLELGQVCKLDNLENFFIQ